MYTRKDITVNGYKFTVESDIADDGQFILMYENTPVIDDPACSDYYGEIDKVADIMAENIKEETEKPFPWFTLFGTIVEQGSDPTRIFDIESAREWGKTINEGCPVELTDESEIKDAKERLDFDEDDEVKHIYHFVNGNAGNFILSQDY